LELIDPVDLKIPREIVTERLLLRVPGIGDAKALHEAVHESMPELRRWMDWANQVQTMHYTEDYIHHMRAKFTAREELTYRLISGENDRFLGNVSIHTINWRIPRMEIGYWLRTSAVGQGYMTEAVRALTTMGFETLHAIRIEIRCDVNNIRSAQVAERAGYHLEATLKRHRRTPQGDISDTLIYVRLA